MNKPPLGVRLVSFCVLAALCASPALSNDTPSPDIPSASTTVSAPEISSTSTAVSASARIGDASPADPFLAQIGTAFDQYSGATGPVTSTSSTTELSGDIGTDVYLRMLFWLIVVILLLLASTAWLRKWLGPRLGLPGQEMRLVSSLTLPGKGRVHILEADGHRFLVGDGGGQISLLSPLGEAQTLPETSSELEPALPEAAQQERGFTSRLQAWQQQMSSTGYSPEVRNSLLFFDNLCRRLRGRRSRPDAT